MKARLGKVIFNVSVRVAVVVSLRGGLKKLSGEQASIAKPEVQPFIQLVFRNQIEFVCRCDGWHRDGLVPQSLPLLA